jgi:hypothetical protein
MHIIGIYQFGDTVRTYGAATARKAQPFGLVTLPIQRMAPLPRPYAEVNSKPSARGLETMSEKSV